NLIMQNYRNHSKKPERFWTLTAPGYFGEYECVLSVSGLSNKAGSLANLSNIFVEGRIKEGDESERITIHSVEELSDVYFTIGHHIHGVVIDPGNQLDKV